MFGETYLALFCSYFKVGSLQSLSSSGPTGPPMTVPGSSSSVDSEGDTSMFHSAELDFTSMSPPSRDANNAHDYDPDHHRHRDQEGNEFVTSPPSSVRSGSGNGTGGDGSSGKSSSSPIAIKSSIRGGGKLFFCCCFGCYCY